MMRLLAGLGLASIALAQMRTVTLAGKSPVVTLRLVFTTGAAADPDDKPGLAHLTAAMLAGGGTNFNLADGLGAQLHGLGSAGEATLVTSEQPESFDEIGEGLRMVHGGARSSRACIARYVPSRSCRAREGARAWASPG